MLNDKFDNQSLFLGQHNFGNIEKAYVLLLLLHILLQQLADQVEVVNLVKQVAVRKRLRWIEQMEMETSAEGDGRARGSTWQAGSLPPDTSK